jgi:hypothetical protein
MPVAMIRRGLPSGAIAAKSSRAVRTPPNVEATLTDGIIRLIGALQPAGLPGSDAAKLGDQRLGRRSPPR